MSFYGELFRKKDEEDIWEELRQMLLNPPSEQEIALKKQEEQAKIDAALEKMFPDVEKPKTEPYLEYEDLFDKPKTMVGEPTGMATPMYEGSVAYEKHLTPYEQIDSKKDWSDELKAQKKAEVAKIEEAYEARNKEINREHVLEQAKNYGGAALEIGSAAVPGYGGAKLAGTLAKKLAPKLGRKIASEIATGTLKGASSGTVAGLGESLLENESLTSTLPKNIAQNIASNTMLNSTGGLINKLNIEKKLNNFKETPKTNPRQYRKMQDLKRQYYDDYISGTSAQKKYTKNSFEVKSKDLLNYSNNIKPLSNGDEYLEEMRRRHRRGW